MSSPHDFDDAAADALIAGTGADIDSRLAETIGDMRAAYASTPPPVGATLAAWIGAAVPASRSARRFERARSSILAKVGAATAAVVAATGGLAVAGALPAPVQDAVSHIGVGRPSHDSGDKHGKNTKDEHAKNTKAHGSSTTVPGSVTSTTTLKDNHGGDVSNVAHDPSVDGCAHGKAVAGVASDGKSQGQPCPTTTTSTTMPGDNGQPGNGNGNENGNGGGNTPPTTVPHGTGQGNGNANGNGSGNDNGKSGDEHGKVHTNS
jgi:hypothetical protein